MNVIHRKRITRKYKLVYWSNGRVKQAIPVVVKARRGNLH